ncbi:MAG: glycosyltransferase family 4 protein [Victivallaceae bacterium]|jgi:glycosyltransferase involved in cell wall biosynthesis
MDILKLKIANVVRRFAFKEWGGTETVIWNTAKCLRELGCNPEILCTRALSHVEKESAEGIAVRRFPYFYPYFPLSHDNKRRLDKKGGSPLSFKLYKHLLDNEYDVVHCHTVSRLASQACKAARRKKIPFVVSFLGGRYDMPQKEIDEMDRAVRHSFNYGRLLDHFVAEKDFLSMADGIICVGYDEYELTRREYPDKLVEYIPNGVNHIKFSGAVPLEFRRKYGIAPDDIVLLCVSRIDYQKNQKLLVEAAIKLKSSGEKIHCVIIGPVTADNYYLELETMIAKNNLDSVFTIIPGLSSESAELMSAYKAADMFVLPSLFEPFGIVVLEAWSAGVPVIVSKVGGLRRLVKDGENGIFFDASDIQTFIDAFYKLKGSPDLIKSLKANSLKMATENYSWEKITGKLLDFYRKVIEKYES